MIGVTQGMITSTLLLLSKEKNKSIRVLGIIIALYCMFSIKMVFINSTSTDVPFIDFLMNENVSIDMELFRYFPIENSLFFPPLIAYYVSLLLKKDFMIKLKHLLHFLPGITFFIYDSVIYVLTYDLQSVYEKNAIADEYLYYNIHIFENFFMVISSCWYLYYSYNILREYKLLIYEICHERKSPVYLWVRNILLGVSGLTVIMFINMVLELRSGSSAEDLVFGRIVYLYIAVFVYYLGFWGYKKMDSNIYNEKYSMESISKKHKMIGLDLIEEKILYKFEFDKIYLDPNISISQLSKSLGVSNEKLSFVINKKFNVNFRDLLNSYRIKLAKEKLLKIESSHQTILSISYDSGFNSQASFYRAFKKFEGVSPKNYISLNQ
ncbi:MAG: AraC family transcriptional regulator [Oceanospirillaceae bacterium]|nr:AraC family transcriptional regulator [Oceanospirillaceae bacterium]